MRRATSRRTSSAFKRSTPGVPPSPLIVCRQLPESPFAVRARPAVLPGVPAFTSRLASVCTGRRRQLLVVDLGGVAALQSVLGGQRRIAWQRQALGVEIVVDLAVAGGVPAPMIRDAGGLLSRLVVAQQVPHLVNEQRRVLFDRVPRHPRVVVVQAPVRVDGHAVDQVGGDRNQAEERRREIAALIGRPHASRLQRARIPVGLLDPSGESDRGT